MSKPTLINTTLPRGIHYTACEAPDAICKSKHKTGNIESIWRGELAVSTDHADHPVNAVFYSPNQAVCLRGDMPACDLQVSFKGTDLDNLIRRDKLLTEQFLKDPKPESGIPETPPPGKPETPPPSNCDDQLSILNPGCNPQLIPFVLFTLAGAAFVYILLHIGRNVLEAEKRPNYRSATPRSTNQSNTSQAGIGSLSLGPLQNDAGQDREARKQLISVIEKLNSVSSRLSQLETDVFSITQQIHSSSIQASKSSTSGSSSIPGQVYNQQVPLPPPRPLSLELIREAVLTNNYSLISSYPHHFVSETIESRQGIGDVKRFAIEADQSQASGQTQSEFIVIPLFNQLYLIPNILPNAADPARTIKRHADKPNIYRYGQGSNLLNLASLAIVQRNGDRYELTNIGQIA
jgi:hypothetical protein